MNQEQVQCLTVLLADYALKQKSPNLSSAAFMSSSIAQSSMRGISLLQVLNEAQRLPQSNAQDQIGLAPRGSDGSHCRPSSPLGSSRYPAQDKGPHGDQGPPRDDEQLIDTHSIDGEYELESDQDSGTPLCVAEGNGLPRSNICAPPWPVICTSAGDRAPNRYGNIKCIIKLCQEAEALVRPVADKMADRSIELAVSATCLFFERLCGQSLSWLCELEKDSSKASRFLEACRSVAQSSAALAHDAVSSDQSRSQAYAQITASVQAFVEHCLDALDPTGASKAKGTQPPSSSPAKVQDPLVVTRHSPSKSFILDTLACLSRSLPLTKQEIPTEFDGRQASDDATQQQRMHQQDTHCFITSIVTTSCIRRLRLIFEMSAESAKIWKVARALCDGIVGAFSSETERLQSSLASSLTRESLENLLQQAIEMCTQLAPPQPPVEAAGLTSHEEAASALAPMSRTTRSRKRASPTPKADGPCPSGRNLKQCRDSLLRLIAQLQAQQERLRQARQGLDIAEEAEEDEKPPDRSPNSGKPNKRCRGGSAKTKKKSVRATKTPRSRKQKGPSSAEKREYRPQPKKTLLERELSVAPSQIEQLETRALRPRRSGDASTFGPNATRSAADERNVRGKPGSCTAPHQQSLSEKATPIGASVTPAVEARPPDAHIEATPAPLPTAAVGQSPAPPRRSGRSTLGAANTGSNTSTAQSARDPDAVDSAKKHAHDDHAAPGERPNKKARFATEEATKPTDEVEEVGNTAPTAASGSASNFASRIEQADRQHQTGQREKSKPKSKAKPRKRNNGRKCSGAKVPSKEHVPIAEATQPAPPSQACRILRPRSENIEMDSGHSSDDQASEQHSMEDYAHILLQVRHPTTSHQPTRSRDPDPSKSASVTEAQQSGCALPKSHDKKAAHRPSASGSKSHVKVTVAALQPAPRRSARAPRPSWRTRDL